MAPIGAPARLPFPEGGKELACTMVGLGGFELPTSPLSGVRSNQLSYRPEAWIAAFPRGKARKEAPLGPFGPIHVI